MSITVVSERPIRAATILSSRPKASTEASRSAGPLPTTARNASDETISDARNRSAAQVDLPEPGAPASTTTAGSGSGRCDHRLSVAPEEQYFAAEPKLRSRPVLSVDGEVMLSRVLAEPQHACAELAEPTRESLKRPDGRRYGARRHQQTREFLQRPGYALWLGSRGPDRRVDLVELAVRFPIPGTVQRGRGHRGTERLECLLAPPA